MQPMFESFPGPLLKSGVGLLARYGNHKETISRRPEQMYTLSDTRLEWPGEGPLFESDSNKHQGPKRGHYSRDLNTCIFNLVPSTVYRTGCEFVDSDWL